MKCECNMGGCSSCCPIQRPSFEVTRHAKGEKIITHIHNCELWFIMEGSFSFSVNNSPGFVFTHRMGVLLMPGFDYDIEAEDPCTIVVFRLNDGLTFRDLLSLREYENVSITEMERLKYLIINDRFHSYLSSLVDGTNQKESTAPYTLFKARGLFLTMEQCYSIRQLYEFFYPLLNENFSFASFVYNNYKKVKNVKEFATLYNSSISPFCKKFKKIFGVSAYKWMMEKRNFVIRYELWSSQKSIKQIAEEQNFSSLSQFCDYCKKHLGHAPGKIRVNGSAGQERPNAHNDW